MCVFKSLRKRTTKKHQKKTIVCELCTKMRPVLLQKVIKFRGNKLKGEPDASAWFLAPVDPIEVPGKLNYLGNMIGLDQVR